MKIKFILFVAIALFARYTSNAQASIDAEKEAVRGVIKTTFKAMLTGDTVLLKSCFSSNANLQIIQNQKDTIIVRTRTAAEFVTNIGKQTVGALDEKSFDEIIFVDHELASAWAPYTFHLNGKFSHKGIDAFQFVKYKDGWKIQYLIYNMYQ